MKKATFLPLLILFFWPYAQAEPKTMRTKKLVVIGMDGLDPTIVERMMKAGELPHFKALAEKGSYSRLGTSNPPQSPVAWSCFISGSNPGQHDVFDFVVRDPSTYMPEIGMTQAKKTKGFSDLIAGLSGPSVETRRKGKTFWQVLGDNGVKSTILRCPVTFPAEKLNGRLISGMGTPDIRGTQGVLTFYTDKELNEKDVHGRIVKVTWSGDDAKTELTGPRLKQVTGSSKDLTVPVAITKLGRSIKLTVQDNEQRLEPGKWSDWFRVSFSVGMMKKITGVVRFHLNSIEPFSLYASPVNIDPQDPAMPISYPAAYSAEIFEHIGCFHTQGMPYDTWALTENRLSEEAFLEQADTILNENLKNLRMELSRYDGGFLFCYFGITDLIQHMFWRYEDPSHPAPHASTNPAVKNAIPNVYRRMDAVLGEIQEKIGKDAELMVLSDHGFGSFRRVVHLNSWLRDNGYLVLKGDAKEGAELFINVDWSQTRAYSLGFGGLYVNQFGREKTGTIYKGAETDALIKEISEKLQTWKDNGHLIVKKIYTHADLYKGPYEANGPDLYVGFNLPYRASWQTGLGGAPAGLVEDNTKLWSGDHLCDPSLVPGVLFSSQKLKAASPTLLDVGPTILHYFGLSDEGMEGKNLD